MSLWELWRARAGTTVRDDSERGWVKEPSGLWVNEYTYHWKMAYTRIGSFRLWSTFGPVRRMQ